MFRFKKSAYLLVLSLLIMSCAKDPVFYPTKTDEIIRPFKPSNPNSGDSANFDQATPSSLLPVVEVKVEGQVGDHIWEIGETHPEDKPQTTITITNNGNEPIRQIELPNLPPFVIISQPEKVPTTLNPGESTQININVNPDELGPIKDEILVQYISDLNPQVPSTTVISIIGEVVPEKKSAVLVLKAKNSNEGPILFPETEINQTLTRELELINKGEKNATQIIFNNLPKEFKISDNECKSTLEGLKSCSLKLSFSSSKVGSFNSLIKVDYQREQNKLSVSLTASAQATHLKLPAHLDIQGSSLGKDDLAQFNQYLPNLNQGSLKEYVSHDIRVLNLGEKNLSSSDQILTMINDGEMNAQIMSISGLEQGLIKFKGSTYPGLKGTCSKNVKSGDCLMQINLSPLLPGRLSDVLNIVYDDGRNNKRKLSVIIYADFKPEVKEPCRDYILSKSHDELLSESKDVTFPYYFKKSGVSVSLKKLIGNETNYKITSLAEDGPIAVDTVKNAQLLLGFNAPTKEAKILDIKVHLDIRKISLEGSQFETTEILCLVSLQKCSGTFFHDSNFAPLNTKKFELINNEFSQLLTQSVEVSIKDAGLQSRRHVLGDVKQAKELKVFRLKKAVSLKDFYGLNDEQLKNLLGQRMHFVVADDTQILNEPRLEIVYEGNECK
jgi:hypothetical protein